MIARRLFPKLVVDTSRKRYIGEKIVYGIFAAAWIALLIFGYMKWRSWTWYTRVPVGIVLTLFVPDLAEIFQSYSKWVKETERINAERRGL